MMLLVEKTKLYDSIYKKYNIKIHQLMKAVDEMNLNDNSDIIAFKKSTEQSTAAANAVTQAKQAEALKNIQLPTELSPETIAEIN